MSVKQIQNYAFASLISILALGAGNCLKAQDPGESRLVTYRVYAKETSRELFSLCDLNRDDRISFRESRTPLGMKSPQHFRPCDPNNDGKLHFDEFDRLYRLRTKQGNHLVIRIPVGKKAPEHPVKISMALKEIFQALDSNQDDRISPAEWRGAPLNLAAALANIPGGFIRLDTDGNNLIEQKEVKRLEILFPQLVESNRVVPPSDPNTLPARYQKIDRNGDQQIDWRELALLLHEVTPELLPYASRIFKQLDKNNDRSLSPRELRKLATR